MPRSLHKLTDVFARSDRLQPGRYSDGGGLYLNVKPTGAKSWVFIFDRDGRRRVSGLGPYPALKLASARKKAEQFRTLLAEGRDPVAESRKATAPSFGECTELFLTSMEGQWRNSKHRAQWRMTLGPAYCRRILDRSVSAIGTNDVLAVLEPIWRKKPETASRLRGRIERVLDYAKVRGWRVGENPAMWRGHLKSILPARQKLTRGHHAAARYSDIAAIVQRLRDTQSMAARALEFLILTASRTGEVLGARWSEFDLDRGLWTVPAERMKPGTAHRVPLCPRALEVIRELYALRLSDFVFPGQKPGRPLSNMAMDMMLRRMRFTTITVHGFRSTFRDWAGEETDFPREVVEAALSHKVGNQIEQAYRRGDAYQKRVALMEAWNEFLI